MIHLLLPGLPCMSFGFSISTENVVTHHSTSRLCNSDICGADTELAYVSDTVRTMQSTPGIDKTHHMAQLLRDSRCCAVLCLGFGHFQWIGFWRGKNHLRAPRVSRLERGVTFVKPCGRSHAWWSDTIVEGRNRESRGMLMRNREGEGVRILKGSGYPP